MHTYIVDSVEVTVPGWVVDLDSFRRWTETDDFPDQGRIWWLKGGVWIDMSKEQIFTHVLVKTELTRALGNLVKTEKRGIYFTDGLLLSNFAADISGNPDGTFLSNETLDSDRIRLLEGKDGGFVEIQGSPDMVLEVLSASSERKDTLILKQGYWEADVPEYWLVDARKEPLQFDIFRHTRRGYVATRKQGGWVKSAVFGKSFRLTQETTALNHPEYTLEVR
jgi:Uma2 family endonuclease